MLGLPLEGSEAEGAVVNDSPVDCQSRDLTEPAGETADRRLAAGTEGEITLICVFPANSAPQYKTRLRGTPRKKSCRCAFRSAFRKTGLVSRNKHPPSGDFTAFSPRRSVCNIIDIML